MRPMKLKLISLLLISAFLTSYGQRQGNIWYFGDHAGLDFNTGAPVALTNGQIYLYPTPGPHSEGSAVISDSTGSLLFYSNGEKVWNKNHIVMPNGDSLLGHPSSTQAALIVPLPQSDRYFYLFTTDAFIYNNLKYGLRYSIIDMCLKNGLGDIITNSKNILLLDTVAEKLTAVKHTNGIDYWVITHKYFSDAFYSYLLTANGITDTVVSHIGSVHQNISIPGAMIAAIGQMKVSPSGEKIALCFSNTNPGFAELFDFNITTGIISNYISLPTDAYWGNVYGVEFSPDNSKLYFTLGCCGLYQFDLTAGGSNADSIKYSKNLISDPNDDIFGMQLGPNGKIYVSRSGSTFLAAINNPNSKGILCDFQDNAISLNGKTCSLGLPNFIDSYAYSNTTVNCETGINEIDNKNLTIKAYPNPAQQLFNIELPNQQNFNLLVYDVTGRKVFQRTNTSGMVTIDCTGFTSGIYFIQVVNEKNILFCKLIKQ